VSRVLLAALLGVACQRPLSPEASVPGEVVARVNDVALTDDDLSLQPTARGHQQTPVSRAALLDALVTEELAAQKAVELGLELDAAGKKELARLQAAVVVARRRALANAWYAQVTRQAMTVTPDEITAYYQDHARELRRQLHLHLVMRRSEAELEPVRQALASGRSLEQILEAQQPVGAPGKPWDLGWVGPTQLAPQWRPVLAELKAGQVSPIIKGDHDRYWLVQLIEEREAPAMTLEAARPLIQQMLASERALPAREAAQAALRQRARVVITKKADTST
jgi:hypothetical protein